MIQAKAERFWKVKHSSTDKKWLSYTPPVDVIREHGLQGYGFAGRIVMDIGVGNGGMAWHLGSKGAEVIAVDIAPNAFRKVNCKAFHTNEIDKAPPVDLAIAHLVFQHCEDGEVVRILRDIRLRKAGFISFQIAESPHVLPPDSDRAEIPRSLQQIQGLIDRSKRRVLNKNVKDFGNGVRWHFFHVDGESSESSSIQ